MLPKLVGMNDSTRLSIGAVLVTLAGVLILWLPILLLHLVPALFVFLLTYGSIYQLESKLRRWRGSHRSHVILSAVIVVSVFLMMVALFGLWLKARADVTTLNDLLMQMLVVLDQLHTKLPASIANHIPASLTTLKETLTLAIKNHAVQFQATGAHIVYQLGHLLIGLVAGVIAAIQIPITPPSDAKPLAVKLRQEFDDLVHSFIEVFFAQVRISAINTLLTAIYLLAILPMIGKSLPMSGTLIVLTFVAGLVPVLGNLISNTFIAIMSLSHGLGLTVLSLAWLISIHKLEYFLNAHIIGHKIKAKAWEILVIMVLLEAMFGIFGLIAAPIIYTQTKKKLSEQGWL